MTKAILTTWAGEILAAKKDYGPRAFLWAQPDAGRVVLWDDIATALDDASDSRAIASWAVDPATMESLLESGQVDDQN